MSSSNTATVNITSSLPKIPLLYIVSAILLCLCFLLPSIFWTESSRPGPKYIVRPKELDPFGDSVYRQESYYDRLEPGTECKPKSVFSSELFQTPALTNMALEKEAKRMAAEFEYSKDDLNKGVKEFIAEMKEGLEKHGTHLSQIPTYVTAVPNGTEKVSTTRRGKTLLTATGYISGRRPWWNQLPRLLHHPSRRPHLLFDPIQSRCATDTDGN